MIGISMAGCGGNSEPDEPSSKESEKILTDNVKQVGSLSESIVLPQYVERAVAKEDVQGVDINGNGTRDDLEHVVFQGIDMIEGVSDNNYAELLSLVNMIQPVTPPVENSIDKHKIYCAYISLPSDIKDELALSLIYTMVLDTEERRSAFKGSVKQSFSNLGGEVCE